MNRIALLSDSEGFDAKIAAKDLLTAIRRPYMDIGIFHKGEQDCDYRQLVDHFLALWDTGQCKYCIAFSRTGNEFQMWANKHPDIVAAPVVDKEITADAVLGFHANMCDIYSRLGLQDILTIVRCFVDVFECQSSQVLREDPA